MTKRLKKFHLPQSLLVESSDATYGKFVAEPFEKGYGHTLGNSLRRILLGYIQGAAITQIKIEGVDHEFSTSEGIVEDITEVIFNVKGIICNTEQDITKLKINVNKEGTVLASDIETEAGVEIINPDHLICTLSKKRAFEVEMTLEVSRGFRLAEDNRNEDDVIGIISLDSVFSPVRKVNYYVEETRVEQRTDFDKLILEITTDGRTNPEEALFQAASIMDHHVQVFLRNSTTEIEFEEEISEEDDQENRLKRLFAMSVNEIELSVRAANCLNNAHITSLGELCSKSESDMLRYRNFGKKSLTEIKHKLEELGLSFNMRIDPKYLTN